MLNIEWNTTMQMNNVMMDEEQVLLPPSMLCVQYWVEPIQLYKGHMLGGTKKP